MPDPIAVTNLKNNLSASNPHKTNINHPIHSASIHRRRFNLVSLAELYEKPPPEPGIESLESEKI
jgi:hypothetical protein